MIYTMGMFDDLLSIAITEKEMRRKNNLFQSGKAIVLYGAGTIAVSTINTMRKVGIEPLYICDSDLDKVGKGLLGIEIISFDHLINLKESVIVIITAGAVFEIHEKLKKAEVNHFAINHFAIHKEMGSSCEKVSYNFDSIRSNIQILLPIIADDNESLGVLYNTLAHYLLLDYDYEWIQMHIRPNQYFYEVSLDHESFVDVGAFDGDTFLDFVRASNGQFSHYYGIEMDYDNFYALRSITAEYRNVDLYNVAATRKDCVLTYDKTIDDKKSDFTLSLSGNVTVNGRMLDTLFAKKRVTFLKADIEGAEVDMLQGAKHMIKTQKPKCAICVYHNLSHFWEVPLLLKQYNPDYKIRFRMHQPLLFETVCYAE